MTDLPHFKRRATTHVSLTSRSSQAYPGFLGTGWTFPPTFLRQEATASMAVGDDDIRQSLGIILATRIGERIMLPTFGSNLSEQVFSVFTAATANEIANMVYNAIVEWEPRVTVFDVSVTLENFEEGKLAIAIDYMVRQTNTRSNLVIPYYLLEATLASGV
jgi:phage baseplate assembly protein W